MNRRKILRSAAALSLSAFMLLSMVTGVFAEQTAAGIEADVGTEATGPGEIPETENENTETGGSSEAEEDRTESSVPENIAIESTEAGQSADTVQENETTAETVEITSPVWTEFHSENISLSDVGGIDFSGRRILVMTDDPAVITDTENIVSSYNGLYLMQYASAEAARNAYSYYYGRAAAVDADIAYEISGDVDAADPLSELAEENQAEVTAVGPLIALIDTGVNGEVLEAVSMLGDDVSDGNGHGTRMYNIIRSIAPDAAIISVKALGADGRGTTASVYAAVKYAIGLKADIINLSLSAYASEDNQILQEVIREAAAAGIKVVVSAGNKGRDAGYFVPACVDEAIVVSASENGKRIESANYGSTVDYYVEADSTSEAAAKLTGYIAKYGIDGLSSVNEEIGEYEIMSPQIEAEEKDEQNDLQKNENINSELYYTDEASFEMTFGLKKYITEHFTEGTVKQFNLVDTIDMRTTFVPASYWYDYNGDGSVDLTDVYSNGDDGMFTPETNFGIALLYDVDPDSDYYIAYVGANSTSTGLADGTFCLAANNDYGEVIPDQYFRYDQSTGILYIAKSIDDGFVSQGAYNGLRAQNVLLAASMSDIAVTADITAEAVTDEIPEGLSESLVNTKVSLPLFDGNTNFSFKLFDGNYYSYIKPANLKVFVNGEEWSNFGYDQLSGVMTLSITEGYLHDVRVIVESLASEPEFDDSPGICDVAAVEAQITQDLIGSIDVSSLPSVGDLITFSYADAGYATGAYTYSTYSKANVNGLKFMIADMSQGGTLTSMVINGSANLADTVGNWSGYINSDTATAAGNFLVGGEVYLNGTKIADAEKTTLVLGCTLISYADAVANGLKYWDAVSGSTGFVIDVHDTMAARVFDVTDSYIYVVINSGAQMGNNFSGAGGTQTQMAVARIPYTYTSPTGNLKITKSFSGSSISSDSKAGVSFRVTGPDGFDNTYSYGTSFTDGSLTISDLTPGEYTITEVNYSVSGYTATITADSFERTSVTKTVSAGGTAEVNFDNRYEEQKGAITIIKSFSGDSLTDEQKNSITFSISGPEYSKTVKYSEFTNDSYTISDLALGSYTVTETNYSVSGYNAAVTVDSDTGTSETKSVTAGSTTTWTFTDKYERKSGLLRAQKFSSNTAVTNGNSCYTFTGIQFKVYTDQNCTTEAKALDGSTHTLTVQSGSSYTNTVKYPIGTYYIKEVESSVKGTGYAYNSSPSQVTITESNTSSAPATAQITNTPNTDPIGIIVSKQDSETGAEVRRVG